MVSVRALTLSLLVLTTQAASAQVADTTMTRLIARQNRVRIKLNSGRTVELQRPRIVGTTLVGRLPSQSAAVEYPLEDLNQVWRRGNAADQGFLLMGGIGLLVGAGLGVAMANICVISCQTSGKDEARGAAVGGVVGALAFGGLGAMFAAVAPVERWKSAYRVNGSRVRPVVTPHGVGVNITF